MKALKITLSVVMTTAWSIAKQAAAKFGGSARQYLSTAMKQAWAAVKTNSESMTDKLIRLGGNRWVKGNMDRIYLTIETIKTAYQIDNNTTGTKLNSLGKAKVWFDCKTESLHSDVGMIRVAFNERGIRCTK